MLLTTPYFQHAPSLNPHILTLVSLQLHLSACVYRTCTVLERSFLEKVVKSTFLLNFQYMSGPRRNIVLSVF